MLKYKSLDIRKIELLIHFALQEIIATRARMGNDPLVCTAPGENDSVCTRATAGIDLVAAQDRKLVVRSTGWEAEPFVVVVLVRVAARIAAGVQIGAALGDGIIDVRLIITGAAASIDTLTTSDGRECQGQGSNEEENLIPEVRNPWVRG